jgi:DNA-binding NtrC family response regulator
MPFQKLEKLAKERQTSIKKLIEDALDQYKGNEFKAAMSLGVYPGTLRYHRTKFKKQEKN